MFFNHYKIMKLLLIIKRKLYFKKENTRSDIGWKHLECGQIVVT